MPLWCLVALYTISTPKAATASVVNTNMTSMCRHGAAGSRRGLAPAPKAISRLPWRPPHLFWVPFGGERPPSGTQNGGGGWFPVPSVLASAEGDAAEWLAGEAVEDAAGHGSGDLATEARLLHEDRDRVGRGVGRGEGGEDGGVFLPHHLRRSRLAGHGKGGESVEGAEGRS